MRPTVEITECTGIFQRLTGRLRWVRPAGTSTVESKLQQEWSNEVHGPGGAVSATYEWKDVPLELV